MNRDETLSRLRAAGPALVLLAVVLWPAVVTSVLGSVFPETFFATYDAPKRFVLLLGAGLLLLFDRRPWSSSEDVLADPLLLLPTVLTLVALVAGLAAGPGGDLLGPLSFLATAAAARAAMSTGPQGLVALRRVVSWTTLTAGLLAIAQVTGLDVSEVGERRVAVSWFGNPGFAAQYMAAALPFTIWGLLQRESRGDRVVSALAALSAVAHLALSRARIDVLAAAAATLVVAVVWTHATGRRRLRNVLLTGGGVAALGAAALFAAVAFDAGPGWLGRSDTVQVRRWIWGSSVEAFAAAPFRITGRPFVDLYPEFRAMEEYRASLGRVVTTPHAEWLQLALSCGVLGLAAVGWWIVVLARRLRELVRESPLPAAALAGTLTATAVSGLASSPLSHPATLLLAGLSVAAVAALRPGSRTLPLPARALSVVAAVGLLAAGLAGPVFAHLRSDAFLALGRRALADGDAAAALAWFGDAAAADARSFEAHYELGTLLRSAGRLDDGIRNLELAHALRTGSLEARTNLVNALRAASAPGEDRHRRAEELADASLELAPWHPLLLTAAASLRMDAGDPEGALTLLDRALEALPPEDVRPAELRLVHARRDEVGLVLDLPGARETALAGLVTLLDGGHVREMRSALRGMLRRAPELLPAVMSMAVRLAETRPEESVAVIEAAHSVGTWDVGFYEQASGILYDLGRTEDGRHMNGLAWELRARDRLERGELDAALAAARKAADRAPSTVREVLLATVHAALGNRPQVVEVLGRALALGNFDPDLVRADPHIAALLPDPAIEEVLRRAAMRR